MGGGKGRDRLQCLLGRHAPTIEATVMEGKTKVLERRKFRGSAGGALTRYKTCVGDSKVMGGS